MSNKEHVETLKDLLLSQDTNVGDAAAIHAAIRALEAEDDSTEYNTGYAAGRKDEARTHASLESRYRALVEAATQLLLDVEAGPARNLEALKPRRSALKAALDALEEQ